MTWVAGVDGCRAGWFAVFREIGGSGLEWALVSRFEDVLSHRLAPAMIGVDLPIGLLDAARKGGRDCDRAARQLLGRPRASSVFSSPVRAAIQCDTYANANAANRASSPNHIGISRQAFGITVKIREMDEILAGADPSAIREVHPELSFWKMNGGNPTRYPKKRADGFDERLRLLRAQGFGQLLPALDQYARKDVAKDDILDAAAVCWTAGRLYRGEAICLPHVPERDAQNLPMAIWI